MYVKPQLGSVVSRLMFEVQSKPVLEHSMFWSERDTNMWLHDLWPITTFKVSDIGVVVIQSVMMGMDVDP